MRSGEDVYVIHKGLQEDRDRTRFHNAEIWEFCCLIGVSESVQKSGDG